MKYVDPFGLDAQCANAVPNDSSTFQCTTVVTAAAPPVEDPNRGLNGLAELQAGLFSVSAAFKEIGKEKMEVNTPWGAVNKRSSATQIKDFMDRAKAEKMPKLYRSLRGLWKVVKRNYDKYGSVNALLLTAALEAAMDKLLMTDEERRQEYEDARRLGALYGIYLPQAPSPPF